MNPIYLINKMPYQVDKAFYILAIGLNQFRRDRYSCSNGFLTLSPLAIRNKS